MPQRNYKQNCALARASDLLGERWTLLIVRDLLIAPRRFGELEARLKGMGANLLAKRLKDMIFAGLITGGGVRSPYRLTEMGRALEPMVLHLIRWSLNWIKTGSARENLHSPDWDLLALKSLFVPDPKMRDPMVALFEVSDWAGWIKVDHQSYAFGLGRPDLAPDVLFRCTIGVLRSPDRALSGMDSAMREKARQILACFPIT
ncbi:MAG: helix-turn-helix domain-containing protein [Azonexus sp.]|nr:helix-turn-helix domain-containing protein [Erythrobacter sp.]MDZ4273834.1 helix-turn-helix domain-containing protein [Erythrobacter sp.]MDZ4315225.1 helix-turn-helix domain-containing protein [Azonexus sp.]